MRPRSHVTDSGSGATVPPVDPTAPVRDRLAERHPDIERSRPEVLDLVAEFRVEMGDALHGQASATAGVRSAAYRRQQLRGEHPLTDVDVAQLILDAPEAVAAALRPLVARLGYQLTPLPDASAGIVRTCAQIARTAGEAVDEGLGATEDGRVDAEEERRIGEAATALERAAAELRASAHRARLEGVRRRA